MRRCGRSLTHNPHAIGNGTRENPVSSGASQLNQIANSLNHSAQVKLLSTNHLTGNQDGTPYKHGHPSRPCTSPFHEHASGGKKHVTATTAK